MLEGRVLISIDVTRGGTFQYGLSVDIDDRSNTQVRPVSRIITGRRIEH